CLELSHHPQAFRIAVIVLLKKAGKDSYRTPKSWRPISLLPCIAKIFEKVLANRL
ncbi:hypothetical protein QBC37DRAFT_242114, partial [Rhypophila decipiens]